MVCLLIKHILTIAISTSFMNRPVPRALRYPIVHTHHALWSRWRLSSRVIIMHLLTTALIKCAWSERLKLANTRRIGRNEIDDLLIYLDFAIDFAIKYSYNRIPFLKGASAALPFNFSRLSLWIYEGQSQLVCYDVKF